tara:strand:- start:3669 stop:4037 length:369 start_codon:yes stop_codon:yes gene_type:complete
MTTDKKQGFIDRVLAFLNLGEAGQLLRFQKKAVRELENNIKINNDQIENLKEKLEDSVEAKKEAIHNIKVDRLSSSESTATYVSEYLKNIHRHIEAERQIESQITDLTSEIEDYKLLLSELQ